jgi:hypothetical protein
MPIAERYIHTYRRKAYAVKGASGQPLRLRPGQPFRQAPLEAVEQFVHLRLGEALSSIVSDSGHPGSTRRTYLPRKAAFAAASINGTALEGRPLHTIAHSHTRDRSNGMGAPAAHTPLLPPFRFPAIFSPSSGTDAP